MGSVKFSGQNSFCQETVTLIWEKKEKSLDLTVSLSKVLDGGRLKNVIFPLVVVCNNHLSLFWLLLLCGTQSFSPPVFEMPQTHLMSAMTHRKGNKKVVPLSRLQTYLYLYKASVFWELAVLWHHRSPLANPKLEDTMLFGGKNAGGQYLPHGSMEHRGTLRTIMRQGLG